MKWILAAVLALMTTIPARTQIREGYNKELSLSGGYQHTSREGSSSGSGAILVAARLGFFVDRGFEIEPEVMLMAGTGFDAVYMLNGIVSYNFTVGPNGVPFLLAGYGISNTIPYFNVPSGRTDFMIGVLNAGAGMKIFLKEDVAVRLEYRFQNFSGSDDPVPGGFYTQEVDYTLHTIHFGFSVLL
jgi:opacity protein-like surface antigen